MGLNDNAVYHVLFEIKMLKATTAVVCIGVILWLAAISTDYWLVVIANNVVLSNGTESGTFLWSHWGLWRRCDYYRTILGEVNTTCSFHKFREPFIKAESITCTVVVLLSILSVTFAFYSILHLRYVYKRVTASLLLMTSVSLLVLVKLVENENMQNVLLKIIVPEDIREIRVLYGLSYLFAWAVFAIYVTAAMAFVFASGRRKNFEVDGDCILN